MMRHPCRYVLFALLALTGLACRAADITFYSYGDSHYGVDGTVGTTWVYRINAMPGSTYPAALGGGTVDPPRGVIALGDLINDGGNLTLGTNEWADWKADYGVSGEGVCHYPVYECFGNHDLNASRFVQKDIIARNQLRSNLTAISTNGLHYSWDWDGVHFVALGIYPADTWATENTYSSVHDPEYALSFLKWDLETNVGDSGRPVVLLHHYDFFTDWWPSWQKLAYPRELDGYNVVLILHGHQGAAYQYDFQGYTVSGENGSLNVVHITTNNTILAAQSTGSNTWGNTLQKSFTMPDLGRSWNPSPRNGARNVPASKSALSWRTGASALTQDVYFGTSSSTVAAAVSPTFSGLPGGVTNCAIPAAFLPLQPGTEYFWRVDESNGEKPSSKGKVWSFRTQDIVLTNDISFLFVSDIHYQDETLTANKRLVSAMDGIPGAAYPTNIGGTVATPRGVVFGGDAATDAKQWQYNLYLTDYGMTADKRLEYPVAGENNGNHDGGLGSVVGNGIVARNLTRTNLTGLSSSRLQTSWNWDGVHFVTLGVRPGANTNPYNSYGSLEFLIGDLATNVGNSGQAVVLFQHFGLDDYAKSWWTADEWAKYYAAIRKYNVVGIFHGHTHTVSMYQWQGIDIYHAPHMQFGGSVTVPVTSSQGFYTVHITSNRLTVAERKADGTWGLTASKRIYLSYADSGLPAVVDNGGVSNAFADTATLTGTLLYESPAAATTTARIYWGPTDGGTNAVAWSNVTQVGTVSTGTFQADVSGLTGNRTYYYRCSASNAAGRVWAPSTTSFTSGTPIGINNSTGATEIDFTSATLNGTLSATVTNPTDVTIYWGLFDGGTSADAWGNVITLSAASTGAFSSGIAFLDPDTRYYYRCFATNAYGSAWADASSTFRTLANTGASFVWDGAGTNSSPADWFNPSNWVGDTGYPNGVGHTAWFTNKTYIYDHQVFRLGGTITLGEVRFANTADEPTKKYVDAFGQTNDTVVFATADGADAEFRYESSGDPRALTFQARMVLSNTLHYLNYQNRAGIGAGAGITGLISGPGGLHIERYHGNNDSDFVLGRAGDPPNTYTGGTTLSCGSTGNRAGTFNVKKNGAFGQGDVTVGAYEIVVLEDRGTNDNMIADQAGLYLQHSGTNCARVVLNTGVIETLGNLYLYNDVAAAWEAQATGTWGSAASSAAHKNDSYFGGTGVVVVTGAAAPLTIQAACGPHGSIVPAGTIEVTANASQAFTISADLHFHVADVVVDGLSQGACSDYSFNTVTNGHTIQAQFAPNLTTNGTPEWWLHEHGLTNGTWDAMSHSDPDIDGMTAWQEWQADTDPTNTSSWLGISDLQRENGKWRIAWRGGQQATQYLERAVTPGGPWLPFYTNLPPTGTATNLLDAAGTNSACFYRLRVSR